MDIEKKVYMNAAGCKYLVTGSPAVPLHPGDALIPVVSKELLEILEVTPRPLNQMEIDEAVQMWPYRNVHSPAPVPAEVETPEPKTPAEPIAPEGIEDPPSVVPSAQEIKEKIAEKAKDVEAKQ